MRRLYGLAEAHFDLRVFFDVYPFQEITYLVYLVMPPGIYNLHLSLCIYKGRHIYYIHIYIYASLFADP